MVLVYLYVVVLLTKLKNIIVASYSSQDKSRMNGGRKGDEMFYWDYLRKQSVLDVSLCHHLEGGGRMVGG